MRIPDNEFLQITSFLVFAVIGTVLLLFAGAISDLVIDDPDKVLVIVFSWMMTGGLITAIIWMNTIARFFLYRYRVKDAIRFWEEPHLNPYIGEDNENQH